MVYSRVSMVDAAQAARPHIVDGREVETKRAVPKGVKYAVLIDCNFSNKLCHTNIGLVVIKKFLIVNFEKIMIRLMILPVLTILSLTCLSL